MLRADEVIDFSPGGDSRSVCNPSIIAHGMSRSKSDRSGEKGSSVSGAVPWALPIVGIGPEEYRRTALHRDFL